MNRCFNYIILTIIFSFILIHSVNAECSYQERKDLLNEAKSVDISFNVDNKIEKITFIDPDTGESEIIDKNNYSFFMNITPFSSDIFLKITNDYNDEVIMVNSSDFSNNVYSYPISNTTDIIKYTFTFYSNKDNCYASKITTRQLKKPKENPIYFYSICSDSRLMDNKYCKQFIDTDFNIEESEIIKILSTSINQNGRVDNENIINKVFKILKKYWYIVTIILVSLITLIVILIIRKKRSEL